MASRRGKKIDTWEFVINHVRVNVFVKLSTSDRGGQSTFSVQDDSLSLLDSDGDINALKVRVKKHLEEHLRVEWGRFLYIEFRGDVPPPPPDPDDEPEEEDDCGLRVDIDSHFEVSEIEIGTKPDGSKCWRSWNKFGSGRSDDGEPDTGLDTHGYRNDPTMRSVVPATPENRKAIETLRNAFLALHGKMVTFLDPQNIAGNLSKASKVLKLEFAK